MHSNGWKKVLYKDVDISHQWEDEWVWNESELWQSLTCNVSETTPDILQMDTDHSLHISTNEVTCSNHQLSQADNQHNDHSFIHSPSIILHHNDKSTSKTTSQPWPFA